MEYKISNVRKPKIKNMEYGMQNVIYSIFRVPRSVRGSMLLELLVVIGILAVILAIGAQSVSVSLRSGKISGERDVAVGLAGEALEAVRGATEERWQNIYNLTKSSQNYYTATSSGKWIIATGTEVIALNNASYTRSFTVANVSRDLSTRAIETTYNADHDDPGTQLITVTVSWSGGVPFTTSEYFFRWKNKACNQSSWSTGGSGSATSTCQNSTYDTKDSAVDTAGVPGSLRLQ
jgi:type II secretory pathway pseudopilin PulG